MSKLDFEVDSKLQCPQIWVNHAIQSERGRDYLEASTQAQVSIALSLRELVEAVNTLSEDLKGAMVPSPVPFQWIPYKDDIQKPPHILQVPPGYGTVPKEASVRGAALEIEANIAYLEDKAAHGSIVDNVSAIIAKHIGWPPQVDPVSPADAELARAGMLAFARGRQGNPVYLCKMCGLEPDSIVHDPRFGSHGYEPSTSKTLGEWRLAALETRND